MAEQKQDHEGHRQRMKERLLAGGLAGFSDHEILEVALFYALPYRNTNELAHRLASHFGGWTQVLEAEYEDLLTVPGVTPHVATMLVLMGQMARRYHRDVTGYVLHLYDTRSLAQHIAPWFLGEKQESVLLVSLDNKRKHLNTTRVFRGSVNSAQFNVREAVKQALRDNATQVVLAHNHPNGFAFPSQTDLETTRYVAQVFKPLDIRLADHLVVAEGDCICMSELPNMADVFGVRVEPLPQVATDDNTL